MNTERAEVRGGIIGWNGEYPEMPVWRWQKGGAAGDAAGGPAGGRQRRGRARDGGAGGEGRGLR